MMFSHQDSPDIRVGEQLIVNVENVFDGGVVVCYQNKTGVNIRGALLMSPASCNPYVCYVTRELRTNKLLKQTSA